ncbi:MAG: hypothetical protein IIB33_01980 [Chloroflexi bacterium]|nr:hypothetical protein [Chloroflexota bacterium]
MPRGPKVASAMAREWLEKHAAGTTLDQLASKYRRTKRTISTNIERARQEQTFELARQEHLKEAVRSHQEDMLDLIQRLKDTVYVPDLELWPGRMDFGLEGLLSDAEWATESEVILRETARGSATHRDAAILVTRDKNGPQEVKLTDEDSRLWDILMQHLGRRDLLWRGLNDWKEALLSELKGRAALNRIIVREAQAVFGLSIRMSGKRQEPHLTRGFPYFVRAVVTGRALEQPMPEIGDRLEWIGDELKDSVNSRTLGVHMEEGEKSIERVAVMVEKLASQPQAIEAARAHTELVSRTGKVQDILEDYRLLHYIRGVCSMCKKLGAP